jgi:hypothetical protein
MVKSPKERRLWSAIHTICGPPHAMPSQVDEKRSKAKGASAPNRRFIVIEGVYANSGTAPTAAIDGNVWRMLLEYARKHVCNLGTAKRSQCDEPMPC